MKKIILQIIITGIACVASAQPCVETDGLKPLPLQYTFDGRPGTCFEVIIDKWNRIYKLNETTGLLSAESCIHAGYNPYCACVCYMQGTYFRRVTPLCDPTPCGGDLPLPGMPITDINNSSSTWSQGSAWVGGQVPIIVSSPAVVISKSLQIDANLILPIDHWLIVTAGNTALMSGQTITNNSQLRIYSTASFESFGTLKGTGLVWGNFTNSGTLSPGNSPGKFTITGNYTATPSAVHEIEIASVNSYDTISIAADVSFTSGTANLSGALHVSLLNGFIPSIGDAFKIVSFTFSTGTFTSTSLPTLPTGLSWAIQYNTSDITLKIEASTLPLNFINVKAYQKNYGVQVNWFTANEINVKNFEVEKSLDGVHFNNAFSNNSIGGSANYEWFDASPIKGNNYYRIKANDIDGKFIYSPVQVVKFADDKLISLYPNPAKKGNIIQLNIGNNKADKIEILNSMGQLLYTNSSKQTGSIKILLPVSLAPGQYIIKVIIGNKVETQKIQIQ